LQDVGNRVEIELVFLQVLAQVVECFEVGVEPLFLRIRDEDHAVRALENQSPARLVKHLAGNRIEVKAGAESPDGAQIERKEIEEKRAVGFGRERDHFALLIRSRVVVNPLQIGGFAAKTGTVVHKLAVDLARGKINKGHNFLRFGSLLLIAQAPSLANARTQAVLRT